MHEHMLRHRPVRRLGASLMGSLVLFLALCALLSLSRDHAGQQMRGLGSAARAASSAAQHQLHADTAFEFTQFYIDTNYGGNGKPGWVRAGDMDDDGDLDIVAGGGYALFVYENNGSARDWARHGNLDGSAQIGANGAVLFDVDGDTDLDVVCAEYYGELGWWENPGGPLTSHVWSFHTLSNESDYLHDIIRVDLDQDGIAQEFVANLNQGYWNANIKVKWYRPPADPTQLWEMHVVEGGRAEGSAHGHAGMDVGDVDLDGNVDLAYSNGWYEAPDDPSGTWIWHQITDVYGISNALLRDLDGDSDLDMVVTAGHHGSGAYWLGNPADPASDAWLLNVIDGEIHHPECLAVLDLDEDDDSDVVTCDLFFGEEPGEPGWDQEAHNIYVFENFGNSTTWGKQNVAPDSYPSHLLQMADMNQDGQLDIISESTGYSVVSYYENHTFESTPTLEAPTIQPNGGTFFGPVTVTLATATPGADIRFTLDGSAPIAESARYTNPFLLSTGRTVQARAFREGEESGVTIATFVILGTTFDFSLKEIDAAYPGNGRPGWSASGDINSDGQIDIVAGGGGAIQWYQAPNWVRHPLEDNSSAGGNGGLVIDVNGDGYLDVVAALFQSALVWWENPGPGQFAGYWSRHNIDPMISDYNHDLAYGDIDDDGVDEIVALYVGSDGVVWYDQPEDPVSGPFTRTAILASVTDPHVGLALCDLDRDQDLDVVVSNRWYEQPADPFTAFWPERTVFHSAVQNVFPYDVNGDGRLDVVAAEGFVYPDGRVMWASAPASPLTGSWTVHTVAQNLDGPENLWTGDLDGDGDADIVSAEMGTSTGFNDSDSNFLVFEGLDTVGANWRTHIITQDVGVSARINPLDVDGDDDIDFAADGNAEDHIYLWVNGTRPVSVKRVYLPLTVR